MLSEFSKNYLSKKNKGIITCVNTSIIAKKLHKA
jgi:hypothetical protein